MRIYSLFSLPGLFLAFIVLSQACPPAQSQKAKQFSEDCFPDRQTKSEVLDARGFIKKIGNIYAVVLKEDGRRFEACNLGKEWHSEGKEVLISGLEKEIFIYERRSAIPFVLTAISAP